MGVLSRFHPKVAAPSSPGLRLPSLRRPGEGRGRDQRFERRASAFFGAHGEFAPESLHPLSHALQPETVAVSSGWKPRPSSLTYVSPIDVLIGVGWLTRQAVDVWRHGRVEDLERLAQADLYKLSAAMAILDRWATGQGLHPSPKAYIARTRDRRQLRFSRSGDAYIEAAYRTHWVSAEASVSQRRRMEEKQNSAPDLVVVAALNDWT